MRPKEIKRLIIRNYQTNKIPVFIWGPPGVGKSSIVRQVADELKIGLIDLRLTLLEPVDLRGVPFLKSNGDGDKEVLWARPTFIPSEGEGILFVDDLPTATPSVQACGYQLFLERMVGEHKLGDGWYPVAAGNRETDRAATFQMPTPLRNRFIHIDFDINVDDWTEWAVSQNPPIHSLILGYIRQFPNKLLDFDPRANQRAFPTPRSWEFASHLMNMGYEEDKEVLSGAIGEGTATEFLAWAEVKEYLVDPKDILEGKVTKLKKIENEGTMLKVRYATIASVVSLLAQKKGSKNAPAYVDNVLEFAMNLPAEFAVLTVKMMHPAIGSNLIIKSKKFSDFAEKYKDVII